MGPLCFTTGEGRVWLVWWWKQSPLPQFRPTNASSVPHGAGQKREKWQRKGGGGGIQTKRVRLKNLPAPTGPEKGNASERLRDSSGPHLNSSGWTLIYRWSLSDTLEKGSGDPLSSAERTMGHKGRDLLGRSWGMPSSCPLLSADASGSKNDWWCVRESWWQGRATWGLLKRVLWSGKIFVLWRWHTPFC